MPDSYSNTSGMQVYTYMDNEYSKHEVGAIRTHMLVLHLPEK